jgi:hypothetical protein
MNLQLHHSIGSGFAAFKSSALGRKIAFCLLMVFLGFGLSGCTHVKEYSIQSYQGPMPAVDLQYVDE